MCASPEDVMPVITSYSIHYTKLYEWTEREKQLMTDMSLAANRPLNWNLLAPNAQNPEFAEHQLGAGDYSYNFV